MNDNRYAILIASSKFTDQLPDLCCPDNDVDGLNEILTSKIFGGFTEVIVCKNKPHYEILRTINKILNKATKNDLILIYYSGHGKLDNAGRLYLATSDTEVPLLESTSIPVQSIRNFLDVSYTTKSALILDCCYSGAIGKAFLRGEVDEQLNVMSGGRGIFIMTSATKVQTAKEKESDGFGVFTKHLLEGIRSGEADKDGDGFVTMNEIYDYVHEHVQKESHQEPMRWGLGECGEMILAKSGKDSRNDRRQQLRTILLKLAEQELLPDKILAKALHILSLQCAELDDETALYDSLLDELTTDKPNIGNFIDRWHAIQLEQPSRLRVGDTEPVPNAPKSPSPETELSQADRSEKESVVDANLTPEPNSTAQWRQPGPVKTLIAKFVNLVCTLIMLLFYLFFASFLWGFAIIYIVKSDSYSYLNVEAFYVGVGIFTILVVAMTWLLKLLRDAREGKDRALNFYHWLYPASFSLNWAIHLAWFGLVIFVCSSVVLFLSLAERAF